MKESSLNTIINQSINRKYWNHKISDGIGGISVQNPFDGFGIMNDKPLYYEAKLIKGGMYAFNFSKIEDHQVENLRIINASLLKEIPNKFYTLFPVGFYKSREYFRILLFSYKTIESRKSNGEKSIKQKELNKFIEQNKYLTIKYEKDSRGNRKQYISDLERWDEVII